MHDSVIAALSLNSQAGRLVSGHGLSRATDSAHSEGFSPCLPGQGLKPISFITFRHGSSRALIQDLLFLGLPLWEYNFAEADFGIQA